MQLRDKEIATKTGHAEMSHIGRRVIKPAVHGLLAPAHQAWLGLVEPHGLPCKHNGVEHGFTLVHSECDVVCPKRCWDQNTSQIQILRHFENVGSDGLTCVFCWPVGRIRMSGWRGMSRDPVVRYSMASVSVAQGLESGLLLII